MFNIINFIKRQIKLKKIKDMQFRQQVIWIAHEPYQYFVCKDERWETIPQKISDFKVEFEVCDNSKILRIHFFIDDIPYKLDINTKMESCAYFINFLECWYSFRTWDTLCYTSATDNIDDFICIHNFDSIYLRFMGIIGSSTNKKYIDVCVDGRQFIKELIKPLYECEPFSKYIFEVFELFKNSNNSYDGILPTSTNKNFDGNIFQKKFLEKKFFAYGVYGGLGVIIVVFLIKLISNPAVWLSFLHNII